MWTTKLTVLAFVLVACIFNETVIFTTTTCNIMYTGTSNSQGNSQLSESFFNYGKDSSDGEYNDNDETVEQPAKQKGFFSNFFQELNNFVDDGKSICEFKWIAE